MKYILTILLFLFSFIAFAQPQNPYTVPTIVSMKAYYGNSSRIYVVETGKDYYTCSPCTTDEITVFAGAGGRKWKQIEDTGKLSKSDTSSISPNALETQARAVNRVAALDKGLDSVILSSDNSTQTFFYRSGRIANFKFNGYNSNADSLGHVAASGYLLKASPAYTGLLSGVGTTQTGSSANGLLDLSQTWNTIGTVRALKINVTNTASNAASLLADFQVAGTSKAKIDISGVITALGLSLPNSGAYFSSFGTINTTVASSIAVPDGNIIIKNANNTGATSGYSTQLGVTMPVVLTSGTGIHNAVKIFPSISQSGTATGITRGLLIEPSFPQTPYDWRSIEWVNMLGWGLYGSGTAKNYLAGNLLIGTTTDVASSKLTVVSTTQGFLTPRMTTTERTAISSPAEGLEVYDLTLHKKYVFDGTIWQACW